MLARAIGLSHRSTGALCSGSPHAGMDALLGAADAIGAGTARVALVVVVRRARPRSRARGFEARAGAGAAAVVLVSHGGDASLGARVTRTHPFLDRYRGDDELATRDLYDPRLFREEVFLPTLRELGEQLARVTMSTDARVVAPRPRRTPRRDGREAARRGTPASAPVYAELGDTGAAAALLGGIGALDEPGTVAIVGFGGGRATALEIDAKEPVRGAATWRAHSPAASPRPTPTCCAPVASSSPRVRRCRWACRRRARSSCAAPTRCSGCSARAASTAERSTPRRRSTRTASRAAAPKFVLEPLARRGRIHTFVVNHTMPAPFVAPLPLAVIDLEDGARVMLQVVGDGDDLAIDGDVELVLRRYAYERGVPVYGYKARPVVANATTEAAS